MQIDLTTKNEKFYKVISSTEMIIETKDKDDENILTEEVEVVEVEDFNLE